ncbi:MAG TPA: hypothetical protein PLX14_14675, partial [Anaerolineales bacterium]|nr:hypothetical protein [Anaerolineales bacterium]
DAPPGSVVNQNICQGLLTYAGDNDVTEDGKPFTRNIGGSEVYGLFLQYQNTCGWWNANCNVPFGIEEFVGMWAMLESNGNEDAAHVIATIIAQNLYNGGNNPATCSVGLCYSGVFNFMAQYSQGKGTLFAGPNSAAAQQFQSSFPLGLGNADAKRSLMSTLGSAALDPNSASGWDRWTGPSNWGNVDDWGKTLRKSGFKEKIIYGTDPTSIYFYFNNAIYFSIRQKQHWESLGVDMTMAPNGHTLP